MFQLRNAHRLVLMILMVLVYFVVELIVGHICNSVTLVADSFHMLSDVLALIVALIADQISQLPRDKRHTYGFQRAEVLGTLVNNVMLITLCFTILVEAIQKLIEPHPVRDPKLVILVGCGGLFINLIGMLLFCGHGHSHAHLHQERRPEAERLNQRRQLVRVAGEEAQPMSSGDNGSPDHHHHHQHQHNHPGVAGDARHPHSSAGELVNPPPPSSRDGAESSGAAGTGGAGHGHSHIEMPTVGPHTPLIASSEDLDMQGLHSSSLHPSSNGLAIETIRRVSSGPAWLRSNLELAVPVNGDVGHFHGSHGHSHGNKPPRSSGEHMNMQATFLHILGDTLGSVIVIVSSLLLWLMPPGYSLELYEAFAGLDSNGTCTIITPDRVWLSYIDPSLSLVLVAIMLYPTAKMLRKALNILMQTVPKEVRLNELETALTQLDGIAQVHDLHVWQLQPDCYIGTVHIRCRNLPEYITVSHDAKLIFHNFNIHCTTIQPEFTEHAVLPPNAGSDEAAGTADPNAECYIRCGNKDCASRSNCCAVKPSARSACVAGAGASGDNPEISTGAEAPTTEALSTVPSSV